MNSPNDNMLNSSIVCDDPWNQWFAGVTDGDGCFYINRKEKNVSFEITTHSTDARVLYDIKNKLKAGTVKPRSGSKSVRYRIKQKAVIIDIINRVNGKLYNPDSLKQVKEVCQLYNLQYIEPPALMPQDDGYLSGLAESDGTYTISVNKSSPADSQISGVEGRIVRLKNSRGFNQMKFKITSSHEDFLNTITKSFNYGVVYTEKANPKNKSPNKKYHWSIGTYEDFQRLYEYFKKYPLKGTKKQRMRLSLIYFRYKALQYHLKPAGSVEGKLWAKFVDAWFKYSY